MHVFKKCVAHAEIGNQMKLSKSVLCVSVNLINSKRTPCVESNLWYAKYPFFNPQSTFNVARCRKNRTEQRAMVESEPFILASHQV